MPLPPPPGSPEPASPLPPAPAKPDNSTADEADPAGAGDERVLPAEGDWPEQIEGMRVQRIAGRSSDIGGHNYAVRLKIHCPNPGHLHCSKSRSTKLNIAELGPNAVCIFLGAWAENFALSEDEHGRFAPTLAEQRSYKARKLPG